MKATLVIKDETNVKIEGLDISLRKKLVNKFKFVLPYARHMPAFKLGRWDGTIAFFQLGGSTFINLLPDILPILIDEGYEIEIDDKRDYRTDYTFDLVENDSFSDTLWPKDHRLEGEPIILNDHQTETINNFLEDTQSIQEVATGAGKTVVTAALSQRCEQYGRTIVVVPNRSLVLQTEEDYKLMGLDVGVIFGGRHEYFHKHTICTWQSLDSMIKKDKKGEMEFSFNDFLFGDAMKAFTEGKDGDKVVAVIVDECHGMKADVLKSMMQGPLSTIPIRWGLTGTVPKEDFNFFALKTSIGEVVGQVTAKELQEKGILANCNVNILQLKDWGDYGSYQAEMKYLTGDIARLEQIGRMFTQISEDGNVLLLVNYVKTGKLLEEMIPNSVFLSGKDKDDKRKEEYARAHSENNLVIIATYGIAAVGLNIPRIFNLGLFEPGKSFVRVIQSIGRGLRLATDKDHVEIWDITSTCKYAKRHLTQRKKWYKEVQYPFTITKLDRD
jgi:superfamily II DNA or RNA helicase